jgi:putative membrane protein
LKENVMWHQMWGWEGGWGAGWGWFGLMHLLWWALAIAGVVAVFRWGTSNGARAGSRAQRPLDILRERYARGDIDKEDYEERKRSLDS